MTVEPALRPARPSRPCACPWRHSVRERVGPWADSSSELEPPPGGGSGESYIGPNGHWDDDGLMRSNARPYENAAARAAVSDASPGGRATGPAPGAQSCAITQPGNTDTHSVAARQARLAPSAKRRVPTKRAGADAAGLMNMNWITRR